MQGVATTARAGPTLKGSPFQVADMGTDGPLAFARWAMKDESVHQSSSVNITIRLVLDRAAWAMLGVKSLESSANIRNPPADRSTVLTVNEDLGLIDRLKSMGD